MSSTKLELSRPDACVADGPPAQPLGTVKCPLCGADQSSARPSIPGRVHCGCGMVYCPAPRQISEAKFYDSFEYSNAERLEEFYGHRRRRLLHALAERISQLIVPPGRWLDIGCGPGDLLFEAAALGWECSGIDCSFRAVEMTRQKGLQAFCGYFPGDMPKSEDLYEVISISHMLEGVESPRFVLRECKQRLRPNGVLVLELKNFCFWVHAERFFRSRCGVWCPVDIRTYSPRTITLFLQASGFQVLAVIPSGFGGWPILSHLFSAWIAMTGWVCSPNIIVISRPAAGVGTKSKVHPVEPLTRTFSK